MLMSSVDCPYKRYRFRQQVPTTWTPFVPLKQWVCKWNQPTLNGRRLAREKRRRRPTREILENRRLGVFVMAVNWMEPGWWFWPTTSTSARSFTRMPFRHPTDEAVGKDSHLLADIDSDILDLCQQCSTFAGQVVAGLIQFTRALNSVKNSFDILLLDHSLEVLITVHAARTWIDKGELLNL